MKQVYPFATYEFSTDVPANSSGYPVAPAPSETGDRIAVLAYALNSTGALAVTFLEGASGSSTGGTPISAAWAFAANGSLIFDWNPGVWFATDTSGLALVVNSSGATALHLSVTYAYVPEGYV